MRNTVERYVLASLVSGSLLLAAPSAGTAESPSAHASAVCSIGKVSFRPIKGTGAFGNVRTRMQVVCSNPAQTWRAVQRVFVLSERNPPYLRSSMPGTGSGVPLPFSTSCTPGQRLAAKLVLQVPGQKDIVKRPRHMRCPSSRYGK